MPRVTTPAGVEIEYDVHGDGEPLVLVMGLGTQLIFWPDEFVTRLVDAGFKVIRFDNRDAGLSTWFRGHPPRRLMPRLLRGFAGLPVGAAYSLGDMAEDTAAVIAETAGPSAHVAGISLGGMIAQQLAIAHPERVRTLVSISSTPTPRVLGRPEAVLALLRPTPRSRAQSILAAIALRETSRAPPTPTHRQHRRRVRPRRAN